MGTTIDAVAVVTGGRWRRRSGRKLADAAAQACLHRAGLAPGDIDLLVNTGLYHDRNLGEPALAALIQDDIGANPEDPHDGGHGTFSFDVANGACGMLTALKIADGFLAAGTIRHALVVASDADPGRGQAARFPFAPAAGALLCRWQDGPVGLTAFRFAHTPDGDGFDATIRFGNGRNRLWIDEPTEATADAGTAAAEVAGRLLADNGLAPADVDLVVANPLEPRFLAALGSELGVAAEQVVSVVHPSRVHTAGLAVALDAAARQGRMTGPRTVLLVSAGAGPTAGAALVELSYD